MLSGLSFREHRAFERFARDLVRLPGPGEGPLAYLLPEARWRELADGVPDEVTWLMALSRATGVYFFPSREWVPGLMRYLKFLGVTRLLEAGAGRGYLTAARELRPEVVLYAWPPPGQSVAPLCQTDFLHYLILIGEAGGGATGSRKDWETLPHRVSPALCRYGRGRTGSRRHRVTVFYGGGQPPRGRRQILPLALPDDKG